MGRKTVNEPRCSNGESCVAYPALGQPAKLSRGNPGTRCFACEERRVAFELKTAAADKKAVERRKAIELRWGKNNRLEDHAEVDRAREVWERRSRSVLTCERGLRSALASGEARLVRRWSRSLRDARVRLAWAEADLDAAEKKARLDHTR
jgi:hypothetical protein